MNDREKLIELLLSVPVLQKYEVAIRNGKRLIPAGMVADHLIANGVAFVTVNNVPSKWIPVTERLPEEKGSYLTARRRDVFVEQWNGVLFSERCHHAQPTHWMPLPEPPKGENG